MRRSTHPTEILLGFLAGAVATFFVEEPLIWFLHQIGLTARHAFSTAQTPPFGMWALWSRVFWGGAFGVGMAWFGTRLRLGIGYLVAATVFIWGVRTAVDWFVVPMFYGHAWVGLSVDALLTPLILNLVWAAATAALEEILTVAAGTWGVQSI